MRSDVTGHEEISTPRAVASKSRRRLPANIELGVVIVVLVLATVAAGITGSPHWIFVVQLVDLYVAAAVFQNVLQSEAGIISLGQGSVFGIAAYTTAIASGIHGLPYWLGLVFGVSAATALGCLFALPAIRVKGFYLAFVTLGAALVLPELLSELDEWTHGVLGIPFSVPGLDQSVVGVITVLSLMTLSAGVGALVFHEALRRTKTGRRMKLAGENPEAALVLGISPGKLRSLAFIVTAAGTGLAGVMFLPVVQYITPSAVGLDLSLMFFLAVFVGGTGRVAGPVVGIALLYLLPDVVLRQLLEYRLLVYGLVTLGVMTILPQGVVGAIESLRQRLISARRTPWQSEELGRGLLDYERSASLSRTAGSDGKPAVEVRDLSLAYGHVHAVSDVSVTIRTGAIHGIIGPNGSGKSTLLNMLSGLAVPDSGSISINGQSIAGMSAHRVSRLGVGRTFQQPRVVDDLSLYDNIKVGFDASRRSMEDVWSPQIIDALHRFTPKELAHAQRRMIEVWRVVGAATPLMLLDEPAAGLSANERRSLEKLLRALVDEAGRTVVLVEHDLEMIWRVTDYVTVLEAGRVLYHGPTQDARKNGGLEALFTGAAPTGTLDA